MIDLSLSCSFFICRIVASSLLCCGLFIADIETIVQFALHEFKYGEPQRGQTMFESILTNYPKRSDLWSVYLDMMIKQGDIEPVRYEKEPRFSHFMMNKICSCAAEITLGQLKSCGLK